MDSATVIGRWIRTQDQTPIEMAKTTITNKVLNIYIILQGTWND